MPASSPEQLGPYRLTDKLGQGGMGAVYSAIDTTTNEKVAVKVLSPALAAEEGFRVRFEAEIESLKKLRHPNIVRLFGYGEEEGAMYYAMERVDGVSLEEELKQGRRFDWREVVQITIKMCRALKHAHDHGIVHRDIKPANILMSTSGEVKLSDFGIARLFGNTRMTSDGGVLGTAEYMAPEQADGRGVTDKADQYSLGGVMYALLAGRPPFRARSFVEMLQLQRFSEAEPVRRYAPDTPAELDRIVAQLLAKDPSKRFANTIMLARSLEAMEKGLTRSSKRDDFLLVDPSRTSQPHLTGLDPFAATLVPSEDADGEGYSIAEEPQGTVVHTSEPEPLKPRTVANTFSGTRFVKVGEEDAEKTWTSELAESVFSGQFIALVSALILLFAVAYWLLRRTPADPLYEQITARVVNGEYAELNAAEPAMKEFLQRFPEDARHAEVKEMNDRLTLLRRARNMQRGGRKVSQLAQQSPLERSYLEAMSMASISPEIAVKKLQAIVDLYEEAELNDKSGREFVEVARQELNKLQRQLADLTIAQAALLAERLKTIATEAESNPAAAAKRYRGVVELYSTKPWAKAMVAEAREALKKLPAVEPKSDSTAANQP